MDGDATVRILTVEHDVARPGFDERFYRVSFEIASGDMGPFSIPIWVHGAFPQTEINAVARTFLAACLSDAADAASQGVLPDDEDGGDDAEADTGGGKGPRAGSRADVRAP